MLKGLERNPHWEYLEMLQRRNAELNTIAEDNIRKNLARSRQCHNGNRHDAGVENWDLVMLRNNATHDTLDAKYDGHFEVIDRKGPDVKLRISNGSAK